jgi:polar amino acid transport system substrate-binding protein
MNRTSMRAVATIAGVALLVTACGADDEAEEPDAPDDGTEEPADDEVDEDPDEEADEDDAVDEDEAADDEEAAGDAGDLELVSEGTLTICSDIPYPPFEYEDADAPSGYSGFDIDLTQEMADNLGLELEVIESGFDGLQSGTTLAAGQCDLAVSAMTITEERGENLEFSEPYYDATQSLIVLEDGDVSSLDDVAGQSLGVQAATTGAEYAEENAPDDTEIIEFESGPDLFTAMLAGTIAAGLQDLPVNVEQVQADDQFEIAEEYETGEQYGMAAAQGNTELIDAVNAELESLREDSTYDEVYDRYFAVD